MLNLSLVVMRPSRAYRIAAHQMVVYLAHSLVHGRLLNHATAKVQVVGHYRLRGINTLRG